MKGGCHCGAIRYEVLAEPFDSDYCHCRDCQLVTGAPVGAWMDFKVGDVRWLKGEVSEYASSEKIRRGFCSKCGTSISYRSLDYQDYFTLSITSLDEPNKISPNYHIFVNSQLTWFQIKDSWPKYSRERITKRE